MVNTADVFRVQDGVLATAVYVAGVFLFNVTGNMSYHGPVLALLFINALVARFTDGTTIYVVPTPTKPKDKGELKDKGEIKGKGDPQSGSGDAAKED